MSEVCDGSGRIAKVHFDHPDTCRWSATARVKTTDRAKVTCRRCLYSISPLPEMTQCPCCRQMKRTLTEFYARSTWPDGEMRTRRPRCIECDKLLHGEYAKENRDVINAIMRRTVANRRLDPERASAHRVYERERMRIRLGITDQPERWRVGRPGIERVNHSHGGPQVPAGPFKEWLESLGGNAEQIARRTEMNPRRVRSMILDGQESVEIDTVDRALTAVGDGTRIDDLYPLAKAA